MRLLVVVAMAALGGALWSGSAQAAPWCGSLSAVDRPAAVGGERVRVVYAIPAEAPDNSAEMAVRIAAELDEVEAWWRREDPSRTPRFDVYADACGLQYDLTWLRVPAIGPGEFRVEWIFEALSNLVKQFPGSTSTKYVVYYDGQAGWTGVCGMANGSSAGSGLAVVFIQACSGIGSALVVVHELVHTFGLANEAVPHGCGVKSGHVCDSTGDVLFPYAQPVPLTSFQLDVGHDDYYAHSGAWFDLQDSPWLLHVAEQVPVAVAITGTGTVASDVPGIDCAASCTIAWNDRSALTLSARAEPGQRFVRWGGACTGSAACQLSLSGGASVTALFAPLTYRLDVRVVGKGTVRTDPRGVRSPAAGSWWATFTSYEPVKLVARAAKGWRLKGWAGSARGTRSAVSVPMSGDTGVRAVFVKVKPKR